MSNFVNDFIAKISELNKKEMIKEVIDGQIVGSGDGGVMTLRVCDGRKDCLNILDCYHMICNFCDRRYCEECEHDSNFVSFVFCNGCDRYSCQLEGCPRVIKTGLCESCSDEN